jgi:hypothetical protein
MGVELHIEELVLHGFAAHDRHRIADAVQQELSRLMAAEGHANLLKNPLSLDAIDAGTFQVQANAKPQMAGTQIARAVYRTMRAQARDAARATATASRSRAGMGGRQL